MNPRERKLRLRKTTVQRLNPDAASIARGGTIDFDDGSIGFICTLIKCPTNSQQVGTCPGPAPDPEPGPGTDGCEETRAFTNCLYCESFVHTCVNMTCDTDYPCLPDIGI